MAPKGLRWALCMLCWFSVAHHGYGRSRRDSQKTAAAPRLSASEATTLLGTLQVSREDAHGLLILANEELLKL
eukprot:COSAG02_NODE_47225_length_342_cov_2.098765_1_plen_72_part_01